ncbi:ArsA-related P-loop ATPase, partial [Pelomicrobium sp. G1]|uniref:ArsA-related P-loop ATPase n=1 Tax=Pelomicrobium sp. G1 TaxID=3452920 RepID=UPI003F76CE24
PGSTTLVLVSRPDKVALDEAARTGAELGALGLANQVLVLNGVFRATDRRDRVAVALARIGEEALQRIPEPLARLERVIVPLKREQVIGIDALSRFFDED